MAAVAGAGKTTREINAEIKRLIAQGATDVCVADPDARHNLGVALLDPVQVTFDGSVGYYCAGMIDGATVQINGSAGWGLAESMLTGTVIVRGSAGNGAAATIRGGTVVIHGDAAARAGVSMKGGVVLIAGNCGYMAGFMAQKGNADRLRRRGRGLLRFDVRVRRLCRRQYHRLGQRCGHRRADRRRPCLLGINAVAPSGPRPPGPPITPVPIQESRRRPAPLELRQARMGHVAGGALTSSDQPVAAPQEDGVFPPPVGTGEG